MAITIMIDGLTIDAVDGLTVVDGLTAQAVKTAENGKNGRERAIHAARILKAYCEACGDDCAGCFLETDSMRWCTARIPELWEIPE